MIKLILVSITTLVHKSRTEVDAKGLLSLLAG